MDKLLCTKREAAKLLSISEDTLDDLRRSGKLNGYRIEAGNPRVYLMWKCSRNLVPLWRKPRPLG